MLLDRELAKEFECLDLYTAPVKKAEREIVGRENEIRTLYAALMRPELCNVILLAEAGAGKTALVQGTMILDKARQYLEVDLARMIADIELDEYSDATMTENDIQKKWKYIVKMLANNKKSKIFVIDNVDYIEVDEYGRLKIDEFEKKLKECNGKIKYVSVTGASNVTGYVNDIHKIAEITHKYKSKIIVDGAQLVPHKRVDMWGNGNDSIDFLVFSGHKLYAPFGGGAIIGLKKDFEEGITDDEGGGTVNIVMDNWIEYLSPPEKDEAGTPNYFGAVSIVEALKTLDKIGFDNIHANEIMLRDRLIQGLKAIPKVVNYGDVESYDDRLGIGVFNIEYAYHQVVAEKLAKIYGISVRQGWFCAHPYCRRLMHISEKTATNFIYDERVKMPGMIRVSFGIYNTKEEVDYFLEAVEKISKIFR